MSHTERIDINAIMIRIMSVLRFLVRHVGIEEDQISLHVTKEYFHIKFLQYFSYVKAVNKLTYS